MKEVVLTTKVHTYADVKLATPENIVKLNVSNKYDKYQIHIQS